MIESNRVVVELTIFLLLLYCNAVTSGSIDREQQDRILDLHRTVLSGTQLEELHEYLRRRSTTKRYLQLQSPQRETSMGYGGGGGNGGMMDGGGMMNGGGMNDNGHAVIMSLLRSVKLIERKVYPLYVSGNLNGSQIVGVETYTTSNDSTVAANLQLHVSQMETLLNSNGRIRRFDPLFASFEDHFDQIASLVEPLDNGVHVWHAGKTVCAASLVKAHSSAVTGFVKGGSSEAMQPHAVPEICESGSGSEPSGFASFDDTHPGQEITDTDYDYQTEWDVDGDWNIPCELVRNITWNRWNQTTCGMIMWGRNFSHSWNWTSDKQDAHCMGLGMNGESSCNLTSESWWERMDEYLRCGDDVDCNMLWACTNDTNGIGWGHAYDRHGHGRNFHLCSGGNCSRCNITSSPSTASSDVETNTLQGSAGNMLSAISSVVIVLGCLTACVYS